MEPAAIPNLLLDLQSDAVELVSAQGGDLRDRLQNTGMAAHARSRA
jgi:hypothetical protein